MGSFSYTTGDPTDLAAGKAIDFADLRNSFADVKTFLTGTNLDATNLAASVFSPYRLIQSEAASFKDNIVTSSGTYYIAVNTNKYMAKDGNASFSQGPVLIQLTASDYAITGLTPRLRLNVGLATNATAPAANFTFGLYALTSLTGSGTTTTNMGALVTGSTISRSAPSASTVYRDVGSDFALPSTGTYVFGCSMSAGIATNSLVNAVYNLQVHWV